jgi:beta-glucosidase
VTATVTNTSTRSGADVAQLYVTDPAASGQPPRQLEGFTRVSLAAGASTTITLPLTQQNLQYWNSSSNAWATSTGSYTVSVGDADSAAQLPLSGTLTVAASQLGQPVTLANPGSQENVVNTAASVSLSGSDSTSGQTLTYSATGLPAGVSINASSGQLTGTPTANGTSTVTVTAKDGNGAQASQSFVWSVAPGTSSTGGGTGAITGYEGLCLDVRGASSADSTPVQVYTCNGTTAQQWTVESNGTVQALGKCLDVTGAGTANGTLVQLYTCNGTGAQSWQAQSNGELINTNSGSCLDDSGSGGSGTQVQIWACGDTSNQQWQLP